MFSVFRVGFVSIRTFSGKKILLIDDPFQRTGFFGGLVLELIPKNVFGVPSHSMLLSIKSK